MTSEIKRCPFRKDENGEFAPCYGAECMAYYEYDRPILPATTCGNYVAEYVRTSRCYCLSVIAKEMIPCPNQPDCHAGNYL